MSKGDSAIVCYIYIFFQLSMELQDFYPQKKSFNPDGTVDEVRFHGYKIPFSAALDLVRTRQVVLKQVCFTLEDPSMVTHVAGCPMVAHVAECPMFCIQ